MARRKADWSELYPEILTAIAGRLDTQDNYRHCRAVCKKWRSSIPQIPNNVPILSPLFPHKFPVNPPPFTTASGFYYLCSYLHSLVIVANTTFLLQPLQNPNPNPNCKAPKPWLITVEELNPGIFILRKPLTRKKLNDLPDNFSRGIDLSKCSVREIRRAYNFNFADKPPEISTPIAGNLVMFFNPVCTCPTLDDCKAVLRNERGNLISVRLKDNTFRYLCHSRVSCFDDIVNYKEDVWAIDRKGRVYVISKGIHMYLFSKQSVCTGYVAGTRKRLVELSEGLYLIDRYHDGDLVKFRVYKLNEGDRKWNEVKTLDGRILFVSTDCCFFASAEEFPGYRENCILFPRDHFPTYSGSTHPECYYFKGASKELEIGVFHLDDGESGLVSTYPGYSDIFWPPPKWLFPDAFSSRWNEEENMAPCEHSQEEELSPHLSEIAVDGENVENSIIPAEQGSEENLALCKHAAEEEVSPHSSEISVEDTIISAEKGSDLTPALNFPVQAFESRASTVNLEELDMRPEFRPILQKIWDLYGNVCEGTVVRSPGLVARALESLAETVLILKSSTGKSLDQSQTETLSATLSDLKLMQFRVDWLAPFVQTAVACQRSKQLGNRLREIESAKARLLDFQKKQFELLLTALEEERKLDKETGSVTEDINSIGPLDLDKCLGEGIC